MLPNVLQCTEQPPPTNYLAPNIHGAQPVSDLLADPGHRPFVIHSSLFTTAALWNGGFLVGILDLSSFRIPSGHTGSRDSNPGLGLDVCVESSLASVPRLWCRSGWVLIASRWRDLN